MEGLSACECPVCFLFLNHTTHEPMSMPCGHTLCKVCVGQLEGRATNTAVRGGQAPRPTFQCPICRLWVSSDSVSLNVTLRDLLSELGRMEERRVLPLGTALNVAYSEVKVEEVLDRGAFGEVCRAKWRGNDVALKLFSTGRPTPETMEAFQREVFVMNCLRHPNVVLLLGACQTPPKLAIIMEFVAGGSLHQLIHVDKRSLSVAETASLATDICRGLQYLHSINVLHRDLKSKNVLLTGPTPCQAKLCDFGLSRMRQESATMTGNIGTVHWTAPEVLNNERYKFSADVYGFGMVLYEMVSGRVPLGHMVPMAVMLAVAVRRERPTVPDNAHPTFQELIRSCSEWVAADRPSLPSVLSSLSNLLPHPQARQKGAGSVRGRLSHQDSLGVIFLSATDSADLMEQDPSLALLARQNLAPPSLKTTPPTSSDLESERTALNLTIARQNALPLGQGSVPWPLPLGGDVSVARDIQNQLEQAQLQADRELAEQLQMKENSFQLPRATDQKATPHSVFPPQPLLDTIKSKMFPRLKHVEAPPTEATPTEWSLRKKLESLIPRSLSKKTSPPSRKKQETTPPSKMAPPPSPRNNPVPPPPPPLPRGSLAHRVVVRDVKAHARSVAQRLRPVQTVEKRAFRVGQVVGGYSQRSLYTTQNLVQSFSKRWLRPVALQEPPPPFPVGRMVQSREKVKRMSSTFEMAISPATENPIPPPLPPLPSSPPRRKLHPAIRQAVERFSRRDLHHVETVVRQKLPNRQELEGEKQKKSEDKKRSKVIEELLDFDRSLLVTVETMLKNKLPSAEVLEIERRQAVDSDLTHARDLVLHSVLTFDPSGLHHVVTQVKSNLPSVGTIELESKLQDQATPSGSHDL